MKNKEIEELLNKLHKLPIDDEYQCEVGTEILELGEIKLLLSYIEQLENNRDKAIDYTDITIEIIKQQPTEDDTWILDRLKGFKNILKGDNDEQE